MRLPSNLPAGDSAGFTILVQPLARDGSGNLTQPSVLLPAPERTEYDPATGNVTWTLSRTDLLTPLTGLLARNAQQHRTRGGTFTVIADPGATLVQVTYRFGTATGGSLTGTSSGVLTLASVGTDPARFAQTLTFLRCDRLHLRDGGVVTA